MKILLLSPLPPPVGGIASWTTNILHYYKNHKSIQVIHQNTRLRSRAITDYRFISRILAGSKDALSIFKDFYKLIKKHNPDIIHITTSGSMGLYRDILLLFLAKRYQIPVVIHFRFGRIPEISKINNWEWKLLKYVASIASAVLVLDNETKRILYASGCKIIYNIPNPVSFFVESFMLNDNQQVIENAHKKIKIIFVGHVVENKGVFDLVKACSLLSNVDELLLIGPYEESVKKSLLKISSGADIEIKFLGTLSKESVLTEMRKASMLVLPSYSEGFPNVIIEAMAMKCPIIATNVGAIASMLDVDSEKPCGIVIEPKDIRGLAEAINIMITDTIAIERLKENAFLKVKEEYTLEKVCDQYEKVWKIACQIGKKDNV